MQTSTRPTKHLKATNIRYDDGSLQRSANQFYDDVVAHKKLRANDDTTMEKNSLIMGDLTVLGDIYGRFHDMDPTSKLYVDLLVGDVNRHMGWGDSRWVYTEPWNPSDSLFSKIYYIQENFATKDYVDTSVGSLQSGWLYQETGFPALNGMDHYNEPVTYLMGLSTVLLRNQSIQNRVHFQIQNSVPTPGYILTCIDNDGTAEWAAPSSSTSTSQSIITTNGITSNPAFNVKDNGATNTGPLQGFSVIPKNTNAAWNNISVDNDITLLFKTVSPTIQGYGCITIHSFDSVGIKLLSGTTTDRSKLFLYGGSLSPSDQFISLNEYGIESFASSLTSITNFGKTNFISRIPYRRTYDAGTTLIPAEVNIGELLPITISPPSIQPTTLIYPGQLNVYGSIKFRQYDHIVQNYMTPSLNQVLTCVDNLGTVEWRNPSTAAADISFENEITFQNKVNFELDVNFFATCVLMPILIAGLPSIQFKFSNPNYIPLIINKNGVTIEDLWVTNLHTTGSVDIPSLAITDFLSVADSLITLKSLNAPYLPIRVTNIQTDNYFPVAVTGPAPILTNVGPLYGLTVYVDLNSPNYFIYRFQMPISLKFTYLYTTPPSVGSHYNFINVLGATLEIYHGGTLLKSEYKTNIATKINAHMRSYIGSSSIPSNWYPTNHRAGMEIYLGLISTDMNIPVYSDTARIEFKILVDIEYGYSGDIATSYEFQCTYGNDLGTTGYSIIGGYENYWFSPTWGGGFINSFYPGGSWSTNPTGTTTRPYYMPPSIFRLDQVSNSGWLEDRVANSGLVTGELIARNVFIRKNLYIPYGVTYSCGTACRDGYPGGVGQSVNNTLGGYYPWISIYNIWWTGNQAQLWIDTTKFILSISSCDYRIKENFIPVPSVLNRLCLLEVKNYELKDISIFRKNGNHIGVIAHELQELFPEFPNLVDGQKDQVDHLGNIQPQSISQEISFVLLKAIQELKDEVELLKRQILEITK